MIYYYGMHIYMGLMIVRMQMEYLRFGFLIMNKKQKNYQIRISIPSNYPMNPPVLNFITRIFHPNVHFDSGEVCLEVLK